MLLGFAASASSALFYLPTAPDSPPAGVVISVTAPAAPIRDKPVRQTFYPAIASFRVMADAARSCQSSNLV